MNGFNFQTDVSVVLKLIFLKHKSMCSNLALARKARARQYLNTPDQIKPQVKVTTFCFLRV